MHFKEDCILKSCSVILRHFISFHQLQQTQQQILQQLINRNQFAPNQSKNDKYNLISAWFNKILKRSLYEWNNSRFVTTTNATTDPTTTTGLMNLNLHWEKFYIKSYKLKLAIVNPSELTHPRLNFDKDNSHTIHPRRNTCERACVNLVKVSKDQFIKTFGQKIVQKCFPGNEIATNKLASLPALELARKSNRSG